MDLHGFPLQFARTRRFSLGAPHSFTVSPDGERVLFVRTDSGTDAVSRLWLYEAGQERALTGPDVAAYATDRAARFAAYATGGELWGVRTDASAPRLIPTAHPALDPRPSPDGTLIAYVAGGALRVVRADGTADRPLTEPEGPDVTYGLPDHVAAESIGRSRGYWWSPESDALLVSRVDTSMVCRWYIADPANPATAPRAVRYPAAGTANAETSLHLVTVEGSRTPVLLPHAAPREEAPPGVWNDPAFEYVVAASWEGRDPVASLQSRDQRTAWTGSVDPVTGAFEPLSRLTDPEWVEFQPGTPLHTASGLRVEPSPRGDARGIRIGGAHSPTGLQVREVLGAVHERVWFTASEEPTEVHVWSHDPRSGFVRLTDEPGVHTAAAGGDTVVVDSRTPEGQKVTVLRGGAAVGRITVLTEEPLVVPRPLHLTLGERELRGRLHLPSWYETGSGRLPVLLSPYAGPGMQVVTRARTWHTAVCQWYAEQGFAVLVTDGRGTPGRGVDWQRTILGDRLGPVLDDQIDALHAAAGRHDALDLERVAVRGWSFSGYLAAGAVLHRPDVFHAAVAGAAPSDRRLYDTYWEERFLGHPNVQPENYERSSLLPYADRLTRPLMLVHGLADGNVFPAHTLRLSRALLAAGRPHTVLPLSGTGHVVAGEGVADTFLLLELDFLKKSLGV
ncbi:prolyl oligopeptidase family serine peptidase [Streptomyces sp. H27-C3]|uniref:prolyl oligopeptidase family serine peptidase n=1 Tax=Streptomyces sp. H27-C3 TaxID=3046305 RepID=UPI0024BA6C29|nr:prolyl oligopeptidase family serine peptidase [Streptomyces sp. H27-C3]MDJ0465549.1 prolyl oligopeptidase family serine peptidase [Streptomyces sp. H27-C3]